MTPEEKQAYKQKVLAEYQANQSNNQANAQFDANTIPGEVLSGVYGAVQGVPFLGDRMAQSLDTGLSNVLKGTNMMLGTNMPATPEAVQNVRTQAVEQNPLAAFTGSMLPAVATGAGLATAAPRAMGALTQTAPRLIAGGMGAGAVEGGGRAAINQLTDAPGNQNIKEGIGMGAVAGGIGGAAGGALNSVAVQTALNPAVRAARHIMRQVPEMRGAVDDIARNVDPNDPSPFIARTDTPWEVNAAIGQHISKATPGEKALINKELRTQIDNIKSNPVYQELDQFADRSNPSVTTMEAVRRRRTGLEEKAQAQQADIIATTEQRAAERPGWWESFWKSFGDTAPAATTGGAATGGVTGMGIKGATKGAMDAPKVKTVQGETTTTPAGTAGTAGEVVGGALAGATIGLVGATIRSLFHPSSVRQAYDKATETMIRNKKSATNDTLLKISKLPDEQKIRLAEDMYEKLGVLEGWAQAANPAFRPTVADRFQQDFTPSLDRLSPLRTLINNLNIPQNVARRTGVFSQTKGNINEAILHLMRKDPSNLIAAMQKTQDNQAGTVFTPAVIAALATANEMQR